MLISQKYEYYRDRDDQNLAQKIKYSLKRGVQAGIILGGGHMQIYTRPRNFAHMFAILGKWTAYAVTGSTLHACITYGIAKQTNTDHIANHFIGGIGCGIAAIPVLKGNHYSLFIVSLLTGAWAAYLKYRMKNYNVLSAFDDATIVGTGGMWDGATSLEAILARYAYPREDPGRRDSERY